MLAFAPFTLEQFPFESGPGKWGFCGPFNGSGPVPHERHGTAPMNNRLSPNTGWSPKGRAPYAPPGNLIPTPPQTGMEMWAFIYGGLKWALAKGKITWEAYLIESN